MLLLLLAMSANAQQGLKLALLGQGNSASTVVLGFQALDEDGPADEKTCDGTETGGIDGSAGELLSGVGLGCSGSSETSSSRDHVC